jgi:two-component system, OmpR family, phosphate regulon sensor histidine kinase PhoR
MTTGLLGGTDEGGSRGFRRIVLLLIWLVIVPTALLLGLAILMLVFWKSRQDVVFGILAITLVGCMVTGGVLALVFLRREAKLSRLQLDFVSKVSHELRTPLTSIRMFAEMLQDRQDPAETALCLETLHKETIRLSERIERLLDWGRMEAGRRVYEMKPEEPEGLVEAAIRAFDASLLGRTIAVDLDVPPGLPRVLADREAIVDALVNLLTNAVKYTGDDRQIFLRVRAAGRALRISVSDNGIGIPRPEQSRIFQKFYRVNDLLRRDVEGSGLGLAIVRHVALGHGGRVEVESEPGNGSTFTILLPFPSGRELREAGVSQPAAVAG